MSVWMWRWTHYNRISKTNDICALRPINTTENLHVSYSVLKMHLSPLLQKKSKLYFIWNLNFLLQMCWSRWVRNTCQNANLNEHSGVPWTHGSKRKLVGQKLNKSQQLLLWAGQPELTQPEHRLAAATGGRRSGASGEGRGTTLDWMSSAAESFSGTRLWNPPAWVCSPELQRIEITHLCGFCPTDDVSHRHQRAGVELAGALLGGV